MKLRFLIDPDTELPHIYEHGINESEVEEVLMDPGFDFAHRGNSRIIEGQTRTGRHLKIVFVPDEGLDSGFVVTAYELRGKALKAYRRRKRRKKR